MNAKEFLGKYKAVLAVVLLIFVSIIIVLVLFDWISIQSVITGLGAASLIFLIGIAIYFYAKKSRGLKLDKPMSHEEAMTYMRDYMQRVHGVIPDIVREDIHKFWNTDIYGGRGEDGGTRSPFTIMAFPERYTNKEVVIVCNRDTRSISYKWEPTQEDLTRMINSMAKLPEEYVEYEEEVPIETTTGEVIRRTAKRRVPISEVEREEEKEI